MRKLAIFDTTTAKIVKYISLEADNILFGAGDRKLIVVLPEDNIIQRYDLTTFEKELTVNLPEGAAATALAIGYASDGPICIHGSRWMFFDLKSLKSLDMKIEGGGGFDDNSLSLRASADGTSFAAWASSVSPTGIRFLTIEGSRVVYRYEHDSLVPLLPSYRCERAADLSQFFHDSRMRRLRPRDPAMNRKASR